MRIKGTGQAWKGVGVVTGSITIEFSFNQPNPVFHWPSQVAGLHK